MIWRRVCVRCRTGGKVCRDGSKHRTPTSKSTKSDHQPTDCTANATAGGYDCVVQGQTVHVNGTANVTQARRSSLNSAHVSCGRLLVPSPFEDGGGGSA